MPSTLLQQPLLNESSLLLFNDITQQSPSLVHCTQALEAAYRYTMFDFKVKEGNK
jgi:hypothetical protein